MSFIKKYCYLAIIASSGLSASEIPSRQWEKVLGDFFTWATPNPNNLTKTIKKLEQANPIDALQEQEKYNKLSALYEQLAETNYRGRGQNNQYQACKTKAVENKKKAEALETTICELKIEQEMKPYEDEITEILNECKTENKTSAWIATIPYYEELLKIADRSHHRNRDFYCDQLTELHKLKLRKEIHEQLPELKRSNNKEKLLQTYSMLLNTSTTDEYTKKIQRNIDSLKSEIEIEQIRNNLETNIACIAQLPLSQLQRTYQF